MNIYKEIKKSFPKMENLFDEEQKSQFLSTRYGQLYNYHLSLGVWIRNYLLKDGSVLLDCFKRGGLTHKDDMSSLMIELFYIYLQSKENLKKK